MVHGALKIARAAAAAMAVMLTAGGIPGVPSRPAAPPLDLPLVPTEVKDRDGIIDVVAHDGPGGPAFRGAHVRAFAIIDERAYLAAEAITDAAGQARLEGLPRGEAWIVAEAPKRARASTRLVVAGDARVIAIDLAPEHAIEVAVKDDGGAPVLAAEIEVLGHDDPLPVGARTGADGAAHVGRLGVGPWRVTARAPGLEEASGRATVDGEVVSMVLRKLGVIAVHVTDRDDRAVEGARVAVAGATLWPSRMATADPEGAVRIGGLTAGTYALRATKDDSVSPIELGVTLARGEERSLTLKLVPGRFVAVHVTEEDEAQPIADTRLTLAEGGLSPFPLEAVTDAKGFARVGPFLAGSATLGARAEGFVSRGAVAVPDPPPHELRVVLVRAGVVTGRVVDARGYPIDGASIQLVGTDPSGGPILDDPRRAMFQSAHFDAMLGGPAPLTPAGELGVVPGAVPAIPHTGMGPLLGIPQASMRAGAPAEPWVTRGDGTFRAAPASPGRVRAIVHHPQYVEALSEVVTLASGGEAHLEIVMHAGGTLDGRVLDSHDRPVAGARVVVSATHGSLERSTLSASDGTFAFAAMPDSVMLTATAGDNDEQTDVQIGVPIPEGGHKEVTIHLSEPHEPLEVTVVDDGGWPVDAAQVTAGSLSTRTPLRVTAFTDGHGEAVLKGARGLPLRVEVRAPGHAPSVTTTDETADSLRVELSAAESATGEVVTARGRDPIAGSDVVLYTDLGVRRVRTDAHGDFVLSELAPGPARLRVRAAGFAPSAREVTVPSSGGRRPFELPRVELAVEGIVEGDVVDGDGRPVAGARVAKDHAPTWLPVGSNPQDLAVTNARGAFALHGLPEGTVTLEAYAPDVGRARVESVKIVAGRTTERVRITMGRTASVPSNERPPDVSGATGTVAVTLGETGAPTEVVVVSVIEASEAERAGLAPGDIVLTIDGSPAQSIEQARAKLSGPISADVVVTVRRGNETLVLRVGRESLRR
ncbi:MAG: carboxypeptidase regulatory-like domain-containing protein [Polyangiaceae bacterium]